MSSLKNLLFLGIFLGSFLVQGLASVDYELALSKSLLYFEAQRSGKLPPNQRVTWRNDSGLRDGSDVEMDLTGGYHDAGDNIKLGFPMAFTTTMLAWSFIEGEISSKERDNLLQAIKWATDYFIKAHPEPEVLYGVVGDGDADHACWERPEDMTTPRYAYKIDAQNPGSDLAAETAAALAAASIVFTGIDTTYSAELILHAKQLFDFAHDHPGYYQNSIPKGYFYSSTGFEDELLWAAAWLHHATGAQRYLDCLASSTDGGGYINLFSWDNKLIGAQLYVAKLILEGKLENTGVWAKYKSNVDEYICSILQKGSNNIPRTPGGLLYNNQEWSPLQYITTSSLAAVVYAKYLDHEKKLQCQGGVLNSDDLHAFARSQVDYILGLNPKNMSYMVGFGANYPKKIHHRASSIVSIKKNDTLVTCQGGFDLYFHRNESDLNVLEGAIVGGPDENDGYTDSRKSYKQSEPSTIIVAPFIGILARLMIAYH